MSSAGVDAVLFQDSLSYPTVLPSDASAPSLVLQRDRFVSTRVVPQRNGGPRRTPRKSVIVVVPDNHFVSADLVTARLRTQPGNEDVDVILACAGQPVNIAALQRQVRDLQVLLAPPGTSTEDLRELAMKQASGDIVTLLCGTPA